MVGTTGESPTVDVDEHKELIRVAVEHARGRIPIIAGTGANSTAEAIELDRVGQEGRRRPRCLRSCRTTTSRRRKACTGTSAIAEAVDLPMILYNVPGRTVADMQNDTVLRLAQVPGIVGIKEATAQHRARHRPASAALPRNFAVYSGDDATALALILLGGHGVISVTANVAPQADARDVRAPRWPATSKRRARDQPQAAAAAPAACSSRPTRSRSSGRWPGWA